MKDVVWPVNKAGAITLDLVYPQEPYKGIVSDICQQITKIFSNRVYSIYIRGSVALGNNIDGVSDLDLIILLNDLPSKFKTEIGFLNSLFNSCNNPYKNIFTEISFQYFDKNYFLSSEVTFFSKFVLKTQSLCIYGTDVSKRFEDIILDSKVYGLDIEYFDTKLSKIKNELEGLNYNYASQVSSICRHVSKFIIRTVFAIFADRTGIYTRDIVFCYHFIDHRSKFWSKKLERLYKWVIKPTNNRLELIRELEEIGPLVSSECKSWIKKKETHLE